MICRFCSFDLRLCRMRTTWLGDAVRTLHLVLECPQCGTSFSFQGIKESKFKLESKKASLQQQLVSSASVPIEARTKVVSKSDRKSNDTN